MPKKTYFISILSLLLICFCSCQESMEERAERDAHNYTRKFCPTPFVNYIRTDSVTFDIQTRTFVYHCTFGDILDDKEIIATNQKKIENILTASVRESTSMKPYVEANFHFIYLCRSEKNPKDILVQVSF